MPLLLIFEFFTVIDRTSVSLEVVLEKKEKTGTEMLRPAIFQ